MCGPSRSAAADGGLGDGHQEQGDANKLNISAGKDEFDAPGRISGVSERKSGAPKSRCDGVAGYGTVLSAPFRP